MKTRVLPFRRSIYVAFFIVSISLIGAVAQKPDDQDLLRTRETVWRAWFAGDVKTVEALVPPETIVLSGGEEKWKHQADVLQEAVEFQKDGGKLVRLEFPKTEVQHFGDVAIVWSDFVVETEVAGKRSTSEGRANEIFVLRDGHWLNPGWHTETLRRLKKD